MRDGRAKSLALGSAPALPERQISNDGTTAPSFEKALTAASDLLAVDPAEALERANKIAAEMPNPRAFRIAAAALRALERPEEAARVELQGIRFGFTDPLKRARAAQQALRSGEAKSLAEAYLRNSPDDLIAMTIAAEAALALNLADEAEPILRKVVDRAPGFPPASILLASALAAQVRLREAAELLESLLSWAPQEISAKRFLADLRTQLNDPVASAALYEEIFTAGLATPADRSKYAQVLREAGRKSESVKALRDILTSSPRDGHAWWALTSYFPEELTDDDERLIRSVIGNRSANRSDLGFLHLATSILHDQRRDYEASFQAITSAQALLSTRHRYDPDVLTQHVDEMIAAYTPDVFERFEAQGSKSDAPIFIVGMPRSGSTLLERMLGQQSKIEALGELPLMPRLVALERPDSDAAYKSLLPDALTGEKLGEMADWYLERATQFRRTNKPHFIDKYNGNWIRAGLIRLMFPNAKIIDIRRDALDSCWAVFRRVLIGDYANDQRQLARHYADYVRFMDAMVVAAPESILTVSYEKLVSDAEGQIRAILNFLGLEFEPACLDFHRSADTVRTASSEQVRRPINREGIGSAEPYRPWLQPLIDELQRARLINHSAA